MKLVFNKLCFLVMVMTIAFTCVSLATTTDTTAPTISMNKSSGSTVEGGTKLLMIVEDKESKVTEVSYHWDEEDEVLLTKSVNKYNILVKAIPSENGKHILSVTAKNECGLIKAKLYTYYVEDAGDKTAPTITATPGNGSTLMVGESVKLVIQDAECKITKVKYSWNNEAEKILTPSANRYHISMSALKIEGTHKLIITAENEEGLQTTKNFVYYVEEEVGDKTAPTITTSITSGKSVMLGESLRITAQDNESKITKVTYRKNGGTAKVLKTSVNRYNILEKFDKTGTYRFEITVENEVGLKTTKSFRYYVRGKSDKTAPTITSSVSSGRSVRVGESLRITAQDNESKITKVTYRKNGGTAKVLKPNVNRYNIMEKFNKAGIYRFEITVENEAGLKTTKNFTYYVQNGSSYRR